MFNFGRSSSGRPRVGSESSKMRRRDEDEDDSTLSRRRSRSSLNSSSKPPRRKSTRRDDDEDAFASSTSRPRRSETAPSDSATYVTAQTRGPESAERAYSTRRQESNKEYNQRDDRRSSQYDYRGADTSDRRRTMDESDDRRRTVTRSDPDPSRRRDSRRQDTDRAYNNHDAALPQNQFFSDPQTHTGPYRPPLVGHASEYYGDQGESVQYQPGVRPAKPSYLVNHEQLHLQTPTAEPKPPPEPTASGQPGAASAYFNMTSGSEAEGHSNAAKPNRPSQRPSNYNQSPRASPDPSPRPPQSSQGINPLAAAAVGAGAGAAMNYYANSHNQPPNMPQNQRPSTYQSAFTSQGLTQAPGPAYNSSSQPPRPSQPTQGNNYYGGAAGATSFGNSLHQSSSVHQSQYNSQPMNQAPSNHYGSSQPPRPGNQSSSSHNYGTAAALGLAGAAAGAYMSHQHNEHQQQAHQSQQYSSNQQNFPPSHSSHQGPGPGPGPDPNFQLGQNQSAFPQAQGKVKRRKTGPLGRLANWWNAPDDVAQYEEYMEYIGVCKDCFDPNCPPGDGPRKHHYHRQLRRQSSKYGSNLRVDKPYRHSSSDDDQKKKSSRAKKAAAAGLAGLGAAKLGQALYNSKNDFDDTYSVKSGRPIVQQRTSYSHGRQSSQENLRLQRQNSKSKLDTRTNEYEQEKHRRRRSSSSSAGERSRGNAMSVGVGASTLR